MQLNFLGEQYKIVDTSQFGLIIEAYNDTLFIPYEVLNEAKSEAPLYRVLGARGTVSAIETNEFNKTASYGICFTRDKNYWIGDLDGTSPGVKLFQFRINQYKLASDYKIITIAESGYQRKDQRSESEERILSDVKNIDRYLECIDTRKGYVERHIERLLHAVENYNSNKKLLGLDSELIPLPIKLTRDLFVKLNDADVIYGSSKHYIKAIATILDYKIPLGENFYEALDRFQIKHDCKKFIAPKVSSNFNELEAKVKEIQAKVPPQPSANPSEESPLIATFKANISDYKKEFKSYGYQCLRITDLNYSLYKVMTFSNNFTESKIDFSAVLTPSDILVTLTFHSKWEARDAMKKLQPLGYAFEQKLFQILFPMPIDINDFGSIMMSLENMEQCLADGTPWFHGIVQEEGFKFNKAKLTYTRRFGLITMNVKIDGPQVEVEVKFSNKIFAPESKSVQILKENIQSTFHLYTNGKHLRLTEFPKNFSGLVKAVEDASDRLAKAKKRYEDNEEMFLKMLDKIRDIGFHDYNRELTFKAITPNAEFWIDIDAEFWTVNVALDADYRLAKKGIKVSEIEFVKNNPLYTKMNFKNQEHVTFSLQSFEHLDNNLKDLEKLVSDFKDAHGLLDSPDAKRFRNMISYLDLEEFDKSSKYYIKFKGEYAGLPLEAVFDKDENTCNFYINDKDFCKSEHLTKVKNFKNGSVNMSYTGYAYIKFNDMDDFRHFVKKFIKLLQDEPFDPLEEFETDNNKYMTMLNNLGAKSPKTIGTLISASCNIGDINNVKVTIMSEVPSMIITIPKSDNPGFSSIPPSWGKLCDTVNENPSGFDLKVTGDSNMEKLFTSIKNGEKVDSPVTEQDLKNVRALYKGFGLAVTETETRIKAEGKLGFLHVYCQTSRKSLRSRAQFSKSYSANIDVSDYMPQFMKIKGVEVLDDTEEVRVMISDVANLGGFLSDVETFVKPDKVAMNSYDKVKDQLTSAGYQFFPPNRFVQESTLTETAIYFEGSQVEVYLEFKDVVLKDSKDKELAFSCFLGLTNKHNHDVEDNGIVFYMSNKVVDIKEVVHTINYFNDAFSKVMTGKKNEVVEEKNIFIEGVLEELKKQGFTVNDQKSLVKFEGFIKSMLIDGIAYKKTKKVLIKIQDSEFSKAFVKSLHGVGDLEIDDSIQGVFYIVTRQVNFFKEFFKRANKFTIEKSVSGLDDFEKALGKLEFKKDVKDSIITYISIDDHDIRSIKINMDTSAVRIVYRNSPLIAQNIEFLVGNAKVSSNFQKDYVLKFPTLKDASQSIGKYQGLPKPKHVEETVPQEVQTAGVLQEPTEVVDNKSTFSEKVLLMLDKYEFITDDDGSGIIVFLKTFGSIKLKGALWTKKDKVEVKLPVNTPTTIGVIKQVPTFDGVKHTGYVGDFEILSISKPEGLEDVIKAVSGQGKMRKGDLINRVFDLKFKKTGDPDHDDAIDRVLAYIKKNQKALVSRADLGVWLLDNPKELTRYKLEYPSVMLMFYESDKFDVKKDPIFLKFYKSKALSIIRQPFKTKDLNGNPCIGVCFYDAKTASKYKLKLIEEAKENDLTVTINGLYYKVVDINESLVTFESTLGIQFVSDYNFLNITVDTALEE